VVSEAPLCGNENQLVLLYIAITLGECAWLLLRNWSYVRAILSPSVVTCRLFELDFIT